VGQSGVIRFISFIALLAVIAMDAHSEVLNIRFSSGVRSEEKKMILSDLSYLKRGVFQDPSGEVSRVMKLPQVSGQTLEAWLAKRVFFILDEAHPVNQSVVGTLASDVEYDAYYDAMATVSLNPGEVKIGKIMENIGTALYRMGKDMGDLYSFRIDGVGKIAVNTPRVGILQIGPLYFNQVIEDDELPVESLLFIKSLNRLSTLFHEARHSDGLGKSLGFPHVRCPKGHAYENKMACDLPSNGSYRIGAMILDSAQKGCEKCSEGQKDALKILRNDSLHRILSEYDERKKVEALYIENEICELNVFSGDSCEVPTLPKIEWNDQPEVLRWKK